MEYRASRKQPVGSGERKVIKSGKRWMRLLMIPVILFALPQSLHEYIWINLLIIAIAVGLFFLFKRSKRLEHDDINLYLIRDKKEQVIPFTDIISIKRSKAKVNGERFWKLKYNDGTKDRTMRFFKLFFNKEFHQLVRKANPKVVIWTHPHFHD